MKKISKRYYFLIGSLIFGMFFGAGNLIFPIHLGQLAGANWGKAAIGFLLSGVLLPLLSLLAISITRSNGIYDLAKPISPKYALIFLILVHATLGPLFATPRTATVPFAMGFAPHIPARYQTIGLLIYSAIFFGIVYYFSVHENGIVNTIGKLLNPAFLVMLFIIFLLAFISPLGSTSGQHAAAGYTTQAMTSGFLEGYNTMDALAGLAFGITVITAIHALGIRKQRETSVFLAKSGIIGVALIGIIFYMFCKSDKKKDTGTILLGFATLMFGMETMSGAVSGLKDVPEFTQLFLMFRNPVLGVLVGAVLTGIIQSSSASVGILQALSVTGSVSYAAAIPIIMGQNIGTCVTAIISAIVCKKLERCEYTTPFGFPVVPLV